MLLWTIPKGTHRPRCCNFERNLGKMALKIAPPEKFLLNVQPELRRALSKTLWNNSFICTFLFTDSSQRHKQIVDSWDPILILFISPALAAAERLVVVVAAWGEHGVSGGGQLGNRGGSLARAWHWSRWQRGSGVGSGSLVVAVQWRRRPAWRQRQLGRSASLAAVAAQRVEKAFLFISGVNTCGMCRKGPNF